MNHGFVVDNFVYMYVCMGRKHGRSIGTVPSGPLAGPSFYFPVRCQKGTDWQKRWRKGPKVDQLLGKIWSATPQNFGSCWLVDSLLFTADAAICSRIEMLDSDSTGPWLQCGWRVIIYLWLNPMLLTIRQPNERGISALRLTTSLRFLPTAGWWFEYVAYGSWIWILWSTAAKDHCGTAISGYVNSTWQQDS